jgi:acyl-CoA synthetase (AMP-forming)/AMP-acid ligase II
MRLIDYLDRGAGYGADRVCLTDASAAAGYGDVVERTWRIAEGMYARGARPGVHAAVLSTNSSAALTCILGILRLGGVWIPLNALHSVDDHDHFLNLTECEWLLYEPELEARARHLASVAPNIRHVISLAEVAAGDWGAFSPAIRDELASAGSGDQTPCLLFGSGGTSGRSKAVVWTNHMMETLVANLLIEIASPEPPVHLVAAPISHAAGVVAFPFMARGAHTVILPKVDAVAIMEAIQRHRVTTLFLPPTAIYSLLGHPRVREFEYGSLRNFIYAAAPMSVEKLKEAIEVFGPVMTQTFGQAEAPMVCTLLTPAEHVAALRSGNEQRLASCGRPCVLASLAILDDEGRELGPNERGEIAARGGLVMPGYYRNPEATAGVFKNGWLCTGDVGYRDSDGFYYIVDRKRDMIISGGYNIFPSEIEQVLWSHPAVQDCAVIGVPDERWGEAVKAIVELKSGCSAEESDLLSLCRDRLGAVRAPKSVEIWETLPRSPVGKVLKRDVRARFWEGRERLV